MRKALVKTSKFLSLVLRHDPGLIGLRLDDQGWAKVDELLSLAPSAGHSISPAKLAEVVETNDKKRFSLSEDGSRIRANQGHSLAVDLGLEPQEPPTTLFHGTASRNLDSIRRRGLERGSRRHVHLSCDPEMASRVGQRHGKPIVLTVRSGAMHAAGFRFFRSANGVWLTNQVPAEFLDIPVD